MAEKTPAKPLIESDRVEVLSGDPRPVAMPADSCRPHRVFRCGDCGTAVWSAADGTRLCVSLPAPAGKQA